MLEVLRMEKVSADIRGGYGYFDCAAGKFSEKFVRTQRIGRVTFCRGRRENPGDFH
jgi:hypothetical protein